MRNLLIFLFIMLFSNCMFTSVYRKNNVIYSNVSREFKKQAFDSISQGVYCGITKYNGKSCEHFHFPDVLIGKNRNLSVFLPTESNNEYPYLLETENKKVFGSPVFLFVQHTARFDPDYLPYSLFKTPTLPAPDNPDFLFERAGIENPGYDNEIFAFLFDYSNIYQENIYIRTWKKDENGNWQTQLDVLFQMEGFTYHSPQIDWKVRKKAVFYLRKMTYPFVIFFDIITFPFQMLLLKRLV